MNEQNRIVNVLAVFCFMFLSIIVFLTYFQLFTKDSLKAHPANPRTTLEEQKTQRGTIFDSTGVVLAKSEFVGPTKQKRLYPFGPLYSHVIGYNSMAFSRTNLEATYNGPLLNINDKSVFADFRNKLSNATPLGNNLHLTINNKLQKLADSLLGDSNGAVVAIEPRTGKVLTLLSKPDFDPNEDALAKNWLNLNESKNSPFLARATSGLYAPGSTFKVVMSALAYENKLENFVVDDNKPFILDGRRIMNYTKSGFGKTDLTKALTVSSNVYFANLGLKLGYDKVLDMAERLQFNNNIPFDIRLKQSTLKYNAIEKIDLANISFGQGKLNVTPFEMALISATIANDGVMMKPQLVSSITSPKGIVQKSFTLETLDKVMDKNVADSVTKLMINVVENGTATNARINGIKVAGKTGTAENEKPGQPHSWFIAFAPAENPTIAIAVMKEYTATSGASCNTIAREIIKSYLK